MFNVQNEVYTWRVLDKVGCVVCQKFLGRPSLSRRDVDLPRRDVKITLLCHVATLDFTSRRQFSSSLLRRDVRFQRRDVIFTYLCHVATWDSDVATWIRSTLCHVVTWPRTSRRRPGLRPKTFHFLHFTLLPSPPKP